MPRSGGQGAGEDGDAAGDDGSEVFRARGSSVDGMAQYYESASWTFAGPVRHRRVRLLRWETPNRSSGRWSAMTADPREPEGLDEFLAQEAEQDEDEASGRGRGSEDPEAPEADAVEQRLELLQRRDSPLTGRHHDEVDPADEAEQARVVDPGDEEYRS